LQADLGMAAFTLTECMGRIVKIVLCVYMCEKVCGLHSRMILNM